MRYIESDIYPKAKREPVYSPSKVEPTARAELDGSPPSRTSPEIPIGGLCLSR